MFPAGLLELMRQEEIGTTIKDYVREQSELAAKKLHEALSRVLRHNTTKKTAPRYYQEAAKT